MIIELFTEGSAPFDLSQLLAYRSGEYSPWKLLQKIEDPDIRVGYYSKSTQRVSRQNTFSGCSFIVQFYLNTEWQNLALEFRHLNLVIYCCN